MALRLVHPPRPCPPRPPDPRTRVLPSDISEKFLISELIPNCWMYLAFGYHEPLMMWLTENAAEDRITLTSPRDGTRTMLPAAKVAFVFMSVMTNAMAPEQRAKTVFDVYVRLHNSDARIELEGILQGMEPGALRLLVLEDRLPHQNCDPEFIPAEAHA